MKFEIGDKVSFLNEQRVGVIKKILSNNILSVEIEDGFEIPVVSSELVKNVVFEHEADVIVFSKKQPLLTFPQGGINRLIVEKEASGQKHHSKKHVKSDDLTEEIDLHIDNLMNHHKYLSNGEIIVIQLNYFQLKLESAIRNNLQRVVFIHGVGNGVLRSEIRKVLGNYSGVDFFDASYARYGYGATEVKLK